MSDPIYPKMVYSFELFLYPPGLPLGDSPGAVFAEASELGAELDTDEPIEGGENSFIHRLPKHHKNSNLVLKRGIAKASSPAFAWVYKFLDSPLDAPLDPRTIAVKLVDESGSLLVSWMFHDAFPVKWEVSPINATQDDIVIETLEFSYSSCERILTSST